MKRKRGSADGSSRQKARSDVRPAGLSAAATPAGVEHPVLRRLYPQVSTLRHHLVSQLPVSSKSRRRRISQLGHSTPAQGETAADVDHELGLLLDAALVGSSPHVKAVNETYTANERRLEIESFTQQRSQSGTGGTFRPCYLLQSEVGRVHSARSSWNGIAWLPRVSVTKIVADCGLCHLAAVQTDDSSQAGTLALSWLPTGWCCTLRSSSRSRPYFFHSWPACAII